jgi:hypothetical protein
MGVDAEKIVSLALGGIGTLTGVISLAWHMRRSRHDRCEFRLGEFRVTYFAVPPGWTYNFIGKAAQTAAPAPVGAWVRFSGRLFNKGYQPGTVARIRVDLESLPDNGEGPFPERGCKLPFRVEAHGSTDIAFRYHLNSDHTAVQSLPPEARCTIILEDQAERLHKTSFLALPEVAQQFSVIPRSH